MALVGGTAVASVDEPSGVVWNPPERRLDPHTEDVSINGAERWASGQAALAPGKL